MSQNLKSVQEFFDEAPPDRHHRDLRHLDGRSSTD